MKKTRRVVGVALLGIVVLPLLLLDQLLGRAIESGASEALGVDARVGFARLRPLAGELRMRRLHIGNPEGFDTPRFLSVGTLDVDARLLDLMEPVVEIPSVTLRDVVVNLEREGQRTNVDAIFGSLDDLDEGAPPEDAAAEKRFVIRTLRIEDVTAHVEWNPVAAQATSLELVIPEIELRDLGAEGGAGLDVAELTSLVSRVILHSVARQGGKLPAALVGTLDSGLRSVGGVAGAVVSGATGTAKDTVEAGAGAVGSVLKGAAEVGNSALGGLFGKPDDE